MAFSSVQDCAWFQVWEAWIRALEKFGLALAVWIALELAKVTASSWRSEFEPYCSHNKEMKCNI